MFLDSSVKRQIDDLTMQAMFHWRDSGPVEHPELTVRFFVHHARRDRDGMFTTLLDCLQAAGVLVNDNLANNNGRTILEPAEFVSEAEERVEILVVKELSHV
jgi:Holliday junction resolvase RusA-like endonuclease